MVSNDTGANMPAGHVAALVGAPDVHRSPCSRSTRATWAGCIAETAPEVVVLLNLSRDQLDRIAEVRMLVDRWRVALGRCRHRPGATGTVVVANADDPMVAWAAATAPDVRWVGAGQVWHDDAVGCPACGGRIEFAADGGLGLRPLRVRPARRWTPTCVGDELVLADGPRHRLGIALPGQFNRANAAMAAVAAAPVLEALGPGRRRTALDRARPR